MKKETGSSRWTEAPSFSPRPADAPCSSFDLSAPSYVPSFLRDPVETSNVPPSRSQALVPSPFVFPSLVSIDIDGIEAKPAVRGSYIEALKVSTAHYSPHEESKKPKRIVYSVQHLNLLRPLALLNSLSISPLDASGVGVEVLPWGPVPTAFASIVETLKKSEEEAFCLSDVTHEDAEKRGTTSTGLSDVEISPALLPGSRPPSLLEEFLDGEAAARLLRCPGAAIREVQREGRELGKEPTLPYYCGVCAQGGSSPCSTVQGWLTTLPFPEKPPAEQTPSASTPSRALRCLSQAAETFRSLLQISLATEFKRGSVRLRWLIERYPVVAEKIRDFLCGTDVPLVPLPPVTGHSEWEEMMRLMGFDAIRDNTTRVVTSFSRHWKRRSIPYEQFVYFYEFRRHVPTGSAVNVITPSVKPGIVAMLAMNVQALQLLHHHGFCIPKDYFWDIFRYLDHSKTGNVVLFAKIRHIGLYLSATQKEEDFFNPMKRIF